MRYKMLATSFLMLFFFVAGIEAKSKLQIRSISVCVLIDENSPVKIRVIRKLIRHASSDYLRNVGIGFKIVEIHNTKLDPIRALYFSKEFRSECGHGQIVAVFTNQKRYSWLRLARERVLGAADRNFSIIWLYDVESRMNENDCNLAPKMTVEHELAHLFGAEDYSIKGSFMSSDYKCVDPWPVALKAVILKSKYKQWPTTSQRGFFDSKI